MSNNNKANLIQQHLANNDLDVCADCSQTSPSWTSINHAVLVCDQCAIIHRSLGRCVSQIKPLKAKDWKPTQLQMIQDLYRSGSNSIWEHTLLDPHVSGSNAGSGGHKNSFSSHLHPRKKPSPGDPSNPNKSDFIRAKYQLFAYVNKAHCSKEDAESESDISEQLHSSVRTPNLKTSLRLLVAGANPNYIHSEKFNSPLHMAAKSGQMSQIELLLVYGANLAIVDSRGKSAVDYAREAGHHEIVYRLIEHQFDLSDTLTRYICQGRQANHRNGEHFLFVDIKADFFQFSDGNTSFNEMENNKGHHHQSMTKPNEVFRNELHQNIQLLSHKSFQELARDIYDEIDRREINTFVSKTYANKNENGKLSLLHQQLIIPFLPVYQYFSTTRNQGRQKLAILNTKELTLLIVDVLNEIRRRVYGVNSLNYNVSEYTDVTKKMDEFDDDDSEPLYDSVPSEEDSYDECNEPISPQPPLKKTFDQTPVNGLAKNSSNKNPSFNKPVIVEAKNVPVNEYSILKEQLMKSTNLMEEFLNENKEMRIEIARLQSVVEKLVGENSQLRQFVSLPKTSSSIFSTNNSNDVRCNSALFDSSSELLNQRNSFFRSSNHSVRPQSLSNYSNNGSSPINIYSNETVPTKTNSNLNSSALSPSKLSNSSFLNFIAQSSQPNTSIHHNLQHFSNQNSSSPSPIHHQYNIVNTNNNNNSSNNETIFGNSSHSSSSSLSSQQQAQHQQQQQQQQMNNLSASFQQSLSSHVFNENSKLCQNVPAKITSTSKTALFGTTSLSPLPSKDEVIKKIEFITNGIKELLAKAREGKHEEFQFCSERICSYVLDMISLFPESIKTSKIDNLQQLNEALGILKGNVLRLREECHAYEINSPNHTYQPNQSNNQDFRFVYNNVIDKAADVATSVKSIINLYTIQTTSFNVNTDRFSIH